MPGAGACGVVSGVRGRWPGLRCGACGEARASGGPGGARVPGAGGCRGSRAEGRGRLAAGRAGGHPSWAGLRARLLRRPVRSRGGPQGTNTSLFRERRGPAPDSLCLAPPPCSSSQTAARWSLQRRAASSCAPCAWRCGACAARTGSRAGEPPARRRAPVWPSEGRPGALRGPGRGAPAGVPGRGGVAGSQHGRVVGGAPVTWAPVRALQPSPRRLPHTLSSHFSELREMVVAPLIPCGAADE